MEVLRINAQETYPWLLEKHYAKRIPNIMFAFGLYDKKVLKGIVTYGMPASPSLCKGVCGEEYKDKVIELNRLCLLENNKNESSILVSHSIKLLPKPLVIVSYADDGQGHVGYVYQATNFFFTGTTKERTDMAGEDGKHSRHSFGDSSKRVHRSAKHRYVFFHGSKTDKKIMKSKLNYEILPYPKGDSKRYDAGGNVITQDLLF